MSPRQNRNALRVIALVMIAAVAVSLILFKQGDGDEPTYQPSRQIDTTDPYKFVKEGELAFLHQPGDTIVKIDVEIADDFAQRAQGLMFRREMDENQGMLFLFPHQELQSFWMKNTILSLDIIFVDDASRIVKIHKDAVPFDQGHYPSEVPAQYVVEVLGGFTERHGIKEGDMISWERE